MGMAMADAGRSSIHRMSTSDVRDTFGDTVNRVVYTEEPVVIERRGRPVVALISYRAFEAFERFLDSLEDHMDAQEIMKAGEESTVDWEEFKGGAAAK